MNKEEVRCLFDIELRAAEDKTEHIQGYALKFNSMSENLGFREIIASGALDNADMSNVVLNFNHNSSNVLARNNKTDGIGSLKLIVDEIGLFFDAIPTSTSYSKDLLENMRAGIINKCSFAFILDYSDNSAQTWVWDTGNIGYDLRTINKIKSISDVSIVTNPAYEDTESNVYVRAKEDNMKEVNKEKENIELRKRKLLIELDL